MAKYRDIFDIQQGGEHGRTALHLAAIQDHEECARILVRLKVILRLLTSVSN
jgi:transient receptor potential cation channel subfamily A protein 1